MRIPVLLFHDVLCAYCTVASARLSALEQEFADTLHVTPRPYPLRPLEARPSDKELKRLARHVRSVAKLPEGAGYSSSVWIGGDPPCSSTPPLVALEAALLQGEEAQRRMLERLRAVAFRGGMNIARRDVILEVAGAVGLDMPRFVTAFDSQAATRAVELAHRSAIAHGVQALPAVVFGDEWLITGVREVGEYRDALLRWLGRYTSQPVRVVH
ncbi:MAG TPA: thioredoxin [Myxococcales bacterium]|nr:thioredoxin [Myxococcales bacterium]